MTDNIFHANPIRSKMEMMQDILKIIQYLHLGQREKGEPLMEDLKARSVLLDDQIQQDVLIFIEQVQFQYAYDPWHNITEAVQKSADKLIEDLCL
jgi:hypothetical protein